MRTIDDRSGTAGYTVSTPEEALLALSADIEKRLSMGLCWIWDYEHPDAADAAAGGDDADGDRERRTVRAVAAQRSGVLGAALRHGDAHAESGRWRWSPWELRFDAFAEANVMDWPRTVGELRGEAALAEATIGELAAHLNAGLRGDLAAVLGDCADFVLPGRGHARDRAETSETVWERFRADSDLYELDAQQTIAAIKAGPALWDALDEWTPAGGVDGDPYAVCRYAWGPMRARVQLTAAELLAAYLAGDAELALHRIVIDYGDGPTELIWPDQPRTCCGQQSGHNGTAPAANVHHWGRPNAYLYAHGRLLPGLRRCPLRQPVDPPAPRQRRDHASRRERTPRSAPPGDAAGDRPRRRRRHRLRPTPLNPTRRAGAAPDARPPSTVTPSAADRPHRRSA